MSRRYVYRVTRMLGNEQDAALDHAWHELVYAAEDATRVAPRRRIAENARRLIQAFGERRDGKRTSPFGQWIPSRLRCQRCHHTTVTRDAIVQVRHTYTGGSCVSASWRCTDCLREERQSSIYERVDVVGVEQEATCAA